MENAKRRIISTEPIDEEEKSDESLRPKFLADYIGQEKLRAKIKIYIEAAKQRGEALDHVLLYGPPGLGKTTLAGIIANEMGTNLKITSGPAIEKPGDVAAILNNLRNSQASKAGRRSTLPRNGGLCHRYCDRKRSYG